MIPLIYLLALAMLSQSAVDIGATAYSTHVSNQAKTYVNDFYSGAQMENSAYWQRYIRMHHLQNRQIKFPYRTGYNYDLSQVYNANAAQAMNTANMARSISRGTGPYQIGLYYNANRRRMR